MSRCAPFATPTLIAPTTPSVAQTAHARAERDSLHKERSASTSTSATTTKRRTLAETTRCASTLRGDIRASARRPWSGFHPPNHVKVRSRSRVFLAVVVVVVVVGCGDARRKIYAAHTQLDSIRVYMCSLFKCILRSLTY